MVVECTDCILVTGHPFVPGSVIKSQKLVATQTSHGLFGFKA
jgi:hypothetical protein